jgi:predicted transcriptional regulator of viral defense system
MKKYLEQLHILKLFHLKDIVSVTGSERSGQELLLNYKKQGLVNQIRRDLYTVTDLATKANIATKFEIGSHITLSAYISYHSALEYHGVAHQVFYNLFISSEQRFNEFEFEDINYNYCKSSFEWGIYASQIFTGKPDRRIFPE